MMIGMKKKLSLSRLFSSALLLMVAILGTGCGVTEVVVVVDGPSTFVSGANTLQIRVLDSANNVAFDETQSVAALGTNAFPVTLSLTPGGADDSNFIVAVTLAHATRGEVRLNAQTSFVSGESKRLDIAIFPSCARRPGEPFCADMGGQTCDGSGGCVSPTVDPAMLPDWGGSP